MDLRSPAASSKLGRTGFLMMLVLLFVFLSVLFHDCFFPGYTLFSNDGPLGALMVQARQVPGSFTGVWNDLNSIGFREGGAMPNITYALLWMLGPLGFSKFYAAIVMLILGLGAWTFFRQLGLAPVACVLGGVATAANSNFFSAACWGAGAHPLTIAIIFLALALLVNNSPSRRWLRVILAGFAVGMAVVEGADIGAIFSLYVSAFVLYQAWCSDGPQARKLAFGIGKIAVVAAFAGFIAAQSISVLVSTQINGVAILEGNKETRQQKWDFATQWSLPKREALGFLVPGLFGYRMDTADGGNYWGAVGRDPNWDRYFANGKQGPTPAGSMRFSGGGMYAGALVLLVAAFAVFQAFRRKDPVVTPVTKRWILFWFGVFVVSLLLAFGRFAPFYQFLYALPYFSTIRNPAKFTYPCSFAIVVLFAYGVNLLYRLYIEPQTGKGAAVSEGLKAWWGRVRGFDRRWTIGIGLVFGLTAVAWLIFGASGDAFEKYLQEVDVPNAHAVAKFSVEQGAIFLLFFAVSILLVTFILSGAFRGPRAKWAGILMGVLLVVDLGRANQPWVITWDYAEKYATNPVIEFLKKEPYQHRVAGLPRWILQVFQVPPDLAKAEEYVRQLYNIEWTQHHFLYYNIQSLDLIQLPRMPEDLRAYETKFFPQSSTELPRVARHWQLTNTKYLIGAAAFGDLLNRQFDPGQQRFRIAERFDIVPKPGINRPTKFEELTAVTDTNGPFAVFEFTGALPRAGLYSNWQTLTNDQASLDQIASASFDPEKTVIVDGTTPATPSTITTNLNPGEAKFVSYAPKDIVLSATAAQPSILLLNDRFDPNWTVTVDGKQQPLLRCNFIMRGVHLQPGAHTVEFRFGQPMGTFYVSLIGLVLAGLLCVGISLPTRSPNTALPSQKPPQPAKPQPVARGR